MKKWRIINKISLIGIISFIVFLIAHLVEAVSYHGDYPYPALGIDIHNWVDRFFLNTCFYLYIFGLPALVSVVLFIISLYKLKRK